MGNAYIVVTPDGDGTYVSIVRARNVADARHEFATYLATDEDDSSIKDHGIEAFVRVNVAYEDIDPRVV
jgi:hypothetical protein